MVRIHSPVSDAAPGRLVRQNHELICLFGRDTVEKSYITDPSNLHLTAELMDSVDETTDALLKLAGQPNAQRRFVASLDEETRLALCMWIIDFDLAAKLFTSICK